MQKLFSPRILAVVALFAGVYSVWQAIGDLPHLTATKRGLSVVDDIVVIGSHHHKGDVEREGQLTALVAAAQANLAKARERLAAANSTIERLEATAKALEESRKR